MGKSGLIRFMNSGKRSGKMQRAKNRLAKKQQGRTIMPVRWKEGWKKWGNWKIETSLYQPAVNYEQYHLTLKEWGMWAAAGVGACGAAAYVFYRSIVLFLILLPWGLLYPFFHKKELCRQRKEQLKSQFKEGVLILAAFLSAGYSVENALKASVNELILLYGPHGMLAGEFSWMAKQISLNSTAEQVLEDFARRSGIEEIQSFSQVFGVAKRSGGELVSIMTQTADSIRDKIQVYEEIRTMTASRQLEQKIMNLLPFFIILYIDMTSPGFFDLMYTTMLGRIFMTVCLAVYILAIWLAKRILDINIS